MAFLKNMHKNCDPINLQKFTAFFSTCFTGKTWFFFLYLTTFFIQLRPARYYEPLHRFQLMLYLCFNGKICLQVCCLYSWVGRHLLNIYYSKFPKQLYALWCKADIIFIPVYVFSYQLISLTYETEINNIINQNFEDMQVFFFFGKINNYVDGKIKEKVASFISIT